jgi:hypothetical protein
MHSMHTAVLLLAYAVIVLLVLGIQGIRIVLIVSHVCSLYAAGS